jgi:hypothetical protein
LDSIKGSKLGAIGAVLPVRPRVDAAEYTSQERAALIMWLLCHGGRYSNDEVATLCGMGSRTGGYKMMRAISRVCPIRKAERDGRWELVRD